jgi:hypothetical protein
MNDEEGRKFILDFLKKTKNKYTIGSLTRTLKLEYPDLDFSNYKVAIWTEHLIATKEVKSLNFGYKVVWYDSKN